ALQPDYLLAHGRRPPRPPLLSLHDALPILREPRAVLEALTWCEGVMLGREAYHRPYVLAELHRTLHPGAGAVPTREALIARMERYVARQLAAGERLGAITRHMLGLYSGEPGARDFRRTLSEGAQAAGAGVELLRRAIPAPARP